MAMIGMLQINFVWNYKGTIYC